MNALYARHLRQLLHGEAEVGRRPLLLQAAYSRLLRGASKFDYYGLKMITDT
jgi:hypothetical protein